MTDDPARRTVLVVDDDELTTAHFAHELRVNGYRVSTAITADAGLQAAEATRPDVVLLDLRMPLMDGLEFLRRFRAKDSHAAVAIVTGDYLIDETVLASIRQLGAVLRFKPLWVEDLVELVRRCLPPILDPA